MVGSGQGGEWLVSKIIPDGPAARSGQIRLGDAVVNVNGIPVKGLDFDAVVHLLAGPSSSV